MGLTIVIPKETSAHETRVAASPDTVKRLTSMGCAVLVEKEAGTRASFTDASYKEAGAKLDTASALYKKADIILKVRPPSGAELKQIKKGTLLIGMLAPYDNKDHLEAYAKAGVDTFSMELVPRISRAQAMDVLSSQSNLAGYKAVLDACEHYGRAFPMMMTAAGTVPPAKVFVMGAGVAGLQAIATARRLGAVVSATDVRPAAKEQVQSLGASFVAVEDEEFKQAETAGGYAKEMSAAYKKKQATLVAEHIAKQDIVITTALIPGRPAPELISESMVKTMKPGSVIVDLAVETGGNCALSKAGTVVNTNGVSIIGHHNVPGRLATDASALYAKNLLNLLNLIIKDASLSIDWEDEIIKGIALTKEGKIVHPNFSTTTPPRKAKTKAKAKKSSAKASPKTPSKASSKKGDTTKKNTKKASAKTTKKTATKKTAAKKATSQKTAKKKATKKQTTSKAPNKKKAPAKKTTKKASTKTKPSKGDNKS